MLVDRTFKDIFALLLELSRKKNFTVIIDEFQVFQSKSNGADIILLISEILSKAQINELTYAAKETGLEILLELHSEKQLPLPKQLLSSSSLTPSFFIFLPIQRDLLRFPRAGTEIIRLDGYS